MINIALVDDDKKMLDTMEEYLSKFSQEKQVPFAVSKFTNAVALLDNYSGTWDIIFMDIQMPYMNGLAAAKKLRELDDSVTLIFLTSLPQYAIKGYEFHALDYILKPLSYFDFVMKMERALKQVDSSKISKEILVPTPEGKIKLPLDEIRYIESMKHHLIYHVSQDKTFTQYSSLTSVAEQLEEYGFCRCNSCYLVNLKYVKYVKDYTVMVDTTELKISQPRKNAFLNSLMEYTGRTLR